MIEEDSLAPPDPNRDYVTYAPDDDWGDHGSWVAMDVLGSHGTRFKSEREALHHVHKVHFSNVTIPSSGSEVK